MVTIIRQYGRAVLLGITALFVFGAVCAVRSGENTGLIRIIYDRAMQNMSKADPGHAWDADAVKAAAAWRGPEITFTYTKTIPKTSVNLDEMFAAKDADGNQILCEITDILDDTGKSILYATEEDRKNKRKTYDTGRFSFPGIGIYTLCIKALDTEKKAAYEQYRFPVTSS